MRRQTLPTVRTASTPDGMHEKIDYSLKIAFQARIPQFVNFFASGNGLAATHSGARVDVSANTPIRVAANQARGTIMRKTTYFVGINAAVASLSR